MKKNLINIALGLLVLSTAACTDEVIVNEQNGLRVTAGITTESRTTFIDDGNLTHTHWVTGDAIGLFTENQSNVSYKAVSDGKQSEFTPGTSTEIDPEDGKKVQAYYPYISGATSTKVPLPYTISLRSNKPVPAFIYSEATINDKAVNFSFKHAFSYLKITVSAEQYKNNMPSGCTLDGGIYIKSENPIGARDTWFNFNTKELTYSGEVDNSRIFYYFDDMDYNGKGSYTYLIPILPQKANMPISLYYFYPQTGNTGYVSLKTITSKNAPEEGFLPGSVYVLDISGGAAGSMSQVDALKELYDYTNGSQWYDNTNWNTNKSFDQWYGLNNQATGIDYVHTVQLAYNNLTGTLPESLVSIMNTASWLDISQNAIKGKIPDAVKNHYKWGALGWLIVPQDPRRGGGLDLTDSKLYLPATTGFNMLTDLSTTMKEIFAQNKLTQIIVTRPSTVNDMLTLFDAARVNQHLDYKDKGFATVIFTEKNPAGDNEAFKKDLKSRYGKVDGIHWMYELPNASMYYNMTYVFDTNGQLVHIAPYSATQDNHAIDKAYTALLQETFGAATSHSKFTFDFYTSTDYSKDGEVYTIQKATEGKGIDLVFIGEGFVDKDMASGGKYETKMKQAADKLFELEPYKSLRKYFNLYAVKVVSPTAEFTEGAEKRIKEDYGTAFDLASKYNPNAAAGDRRMVVVIYNTESYVGRSYCAMYSNGDFVAFNMDVLDNTLIHEVGGHGIAKLADEYVEGGYEFTTLPQEEKDNLDKFYQYQWGWYTNVDYNSTKSTVRWSRFLNDSRYAQDGLGIYEGAFTYGKGVYRSSVNSMMNLNISWFNAPSRENIYKAVMTMSKGSTWKYDYEEFVKFDKNNIGNVSSRSAKMKLSPKEIHELREKHRKPVFIEGSWQDAVRSSRAKATIPLR